ncbi:MAG: bifunctional 5,10-methylenetetrahydrofolate dehydrogenase/5,10-methenyltetrahydrofolate cyclohydrolase [Candidatus Omnitrophota bacterium]
MAAELLKGKPIADGIKEGIKKEAEALKQKGAALKLAAVQVGENAASAVYLKSQAKTADALGISYELHTLPDATTEGELIAFIKKLNSDTSVTAIILQLPVPKQINARKVILNIDPKKDAEGMHPVNLGKILLAEQRLAPCTASAVMEILRSTGQKLYGKEAVVVGHSEIVGKPLSLMLLSEFATTTVCHIGTGERGLLPEHVKRAEILVVAVGRAGLIKGEWIKEGAIVVDVGINRVGDKIVGDVEFEAASERASLITPVPGGVGPLTVTLLMRNVLEAHKVQGE